MRRASRRAEAECWHTGHPCRSSTFDPGAPHGAPDGTPVRRVRWKVMSAVSGLVITSVLGPSRPRRRYFSVTRLRRVYVPRKVGYSGRVFSSPVGERSSSQTLKKTTVYLKLHQEEMSESLFHTRAARPRSHIQANLFPASGTILPPDLTEPPTIGTLHRGRHLRSVNRQPLTNLKHPYDVSR